jgi:hypothetical protein
MLNFFKKNKRDIYKDLVIKKPIHEEYSDSELFQALQGKFIHVDSTFQT